MLKTRLALAAILAALPAVAGSQGVPVCLPRPDMVEFLRQKYGEAPRFQGANDSQLTELFVNDATGSWTIVMTPPRGLSCMRAAGQGATMLDAVEPEEKA